MSIIQSSALHSSQLSDLWETLRCVWGPGEFGAAPTAPTADILRYRESLTTGQHYSRGINGTTVLETGLDGLEIATTIPGLFSPSANASGSMLQEGERLFIFKEIPATANYPANTIYATDQVLYETHKWAMSPGRQLWNDPASLLSLMFAVEVNP